MVQIAYHIEKSPGFVFSCLSDAQKFVAVHPIIFRMDSLGENRFRVFERVRIGFIPYTNRYIASVDADAGEQVVRMRAVIRNVVSIEMVFRMVAFGNGTAVTEDIHIASRIPVKAILQPFLIKQHKMLFANMEKAEAYAEA